MDVIDASSKSCPIYSVSCRTEKLVAADEQRKICNVVCTFTVIRGTVELFVEHSGFVERFTTDNLNADGDPSIETGSDGLSMGCPGQCFDLPSPRFDPFIPNKFDNENLTIQIEQFLERKFGAELSQ
jgi:hypothetical protein